MAQRVTLYLHASKESNWDKGFEAGLTEDQLDKFRYACNEVEVEVEVSETGYATIVKVDGRDVAKEKSDVPQTHPRS